MNYLLFTYFGEDVHDKDNSGRRTSWIDRR